MFSKGVVVVVLVAFALHARAECIKSFSPFGPDVEAITSGEPKSWLDMWDRCWARSSGWRLLQGIDVLSLSDRQLCKGGQVPFGLLKTNSGLSLMDGEDWTNDTTLHFDTTKDVPLGEFETGYGVLDLTTGLIHFTDMNATFTCALCQSIAVKHVDDLPYSYYNDAWENTFYLVKLVSNDKHSSVHRLSKEQQTIFEKKISLKLENFDGQKIVYENSFLDSDGFLEMSFHIRMNGSYGDALDVTKYQHVHLDAKYTMSIDDVTNCSKEIVTGANGEVSVWEANSFGSTQNKLDSLKWTLSQRKCEIDAVLGRPLWSQPIIWIINHKPCSDLEQYANNVEYKSILGPEIEYNQRHQLQQYTKTPVDVATFDEVARLTSREIRATDTLTSDMHDDLKQILAALHTNGKVVIVQKPSVNFVVADLHVKAHAVNGFTMSFVETALSEIGDKITVGVNKRAQPNQTVPLPTVSLTVSSGIVDHSERIAFVSLLKPLESWDPKSLKKYIQIDVVVAGPSVAKAATDSFIDISYDISNIEGASNVTCRIIRNDDEGYSIYYMQGSRSNGCIHLESESATKILCRCQTEFLTNKNGVFSGTIELKENDERYDFEQKSYSYGDTYNSELRSIISPYNYRD